MAKMTVFIAEKKTKTTCFGLYRSSSGFHNSLWFKHTTGMTHLRTWSWTYSYVLLMMGRGTARNM